MAADATTSEPRWKRRGRLALRAPLLLAPLAIVSLPPVRAALIALASAMRGGGARVAVLYVAIYALSGLLAAPIALLAAIAGFAYGPARGAALAIPGVALNALVAFGAGRLWLGPTVRRMVAGNPRWNAIERVVRARGLRLVLLLRLSPVIPQNLLNYALASTRVRTRDFALGSALGLVPMTVASAYAGAAFADAATLLREGASRAGPARWIVPAGGLALSLAALACAAWLARRALREALRDEPAVPP